MIDLLMSDHLLTAPGSADSCIAKSIGAQGAVRVDSNSIPHLHLFVQNHVRKKDAVFSHEGVPSNHAACIETGSRADSSPFVDHATRPNDDSITQDRRIRDDG